MEKHNLARLLHVFLPFTSMLIVRDLLIIIFHKLGINSYFTSLIAFSLSVAVAAFVFKLKSFASMCGEDTRDVSRAPYRKKVRFARNAMHFSLAFALLIELMRVVGVVIAGYSSPMPDTSVISVIALIIVHPLLEEYLFRGLFYGELRAMNPIFSCLVQAVMFALVHDSVSAVIYALGAGVILGITAERTGSLVPCIAAHCLINARSLLYMTVFAEYSAVCSAIDALFVLPGVMSFVVLALTHGRESLVNEEKMIGEEDAHD